MGMFSGMNQAEPGGSRPYIQPGKFVFKVHANKMIESKKKRGQYYFIGELEVLESSDSNFPAGLMMSYSRNMANGGYPELALAEIRQYLHVCINSMQASLGEEPVSLEDIVEETAETAVGEDNPLKGVIIACHAWRKDPADKDSWINKEFSVPENLQDFL